MVIDVGEDDEDESTKQHVKEAVAKELILSYLQPTGEDVDLGNTISGARKYLLSAWFEEDEDQGNRKFYLNTWKQPEQNLGNLTLSPSGTSALLLYLSAQSSRSLLPSASTPSTTLVSMLSTILHVLEEPQPKNRTKAMKALASIVEADPRALVSDPRVMPAISSRMWDLSVAVREAAVDLVGRYMLYRFVKCYQH